MVVAANGSLLKHTGVSLTEIYLGFFLSSIIAVPLGLFMGTFRIVAAAVEPVVNFMRYLPVTALIPLLILWIGIGLEEKIAVIFLGTFFQQIVLCADVSAQVSDDLYNVSYTLGANRRQVITRVMLPATLPGVMDTLACDHGLGVDLSRGGRAGGRFIGAWLHDLAGHARAAPGDHLCRHLHDWVLGSDHRFGFQMGESAPLCPGRR